MAENKLQVIYRISDKGNPKPKLPNGGKWDCLFNAVQEFGAENFHVIADNCTQETIKALRATGLSLELTANGNSGTCRYIFEEVINRYAPEDNLYLLEDDYLHLPGSRTALLEGLKLPTTSRSTTTPIYITPTAEVPVLLSTTVCLKVQFI